MWRKKFWGTEGEDRKCSWNVSCVSVARDLLWNMPWRASPGAQGAVMERQYKLHEDMACSAVCTQPVPTTFNGICSIGNLANGKEKGTKYTFKLMLNHLNIKPPYVLYPVLDESVAPLLWNYLMQIEYLLIRIFWDLLIRGWSFHSRALSVPELQLGCKHSAPR